MIHDHQYSGYRFTFEPAVDDEIERRILQNQQFSEQICKFYQKGTCMKGEGCQFRHIRGVRKEVCKHWLRGLCKKGDFCEYLHEYDHTKMPPCRFFQNYGKCNNPECYFLHIRPEDRVNECIWYSRGFCKHGPNCRNRHTRKDPCPDFLMGFCYKGPNCEYGHPKFEIQAYEILDTAATVTCSKCDTVGHYSHQCPMTTTSTANVSRDQDEPQARRKEFRDVSSVTCYKCGTKGHYANACTNPRQQRT